MKLKKGCMCVEYDGKAYSVVSFDGRIARLREITDDDRILDPIEVCNADTLEFFPCPEN